MPSPEELAREKIDKLLTDCGWILQNRRTINLSASRGVAVRGALLRDRDEVVSMMALSILLLELVWNIDFWVRLASGKSLVALSAYMFDPKIPPFIRALSLFHVALPILLVWLLHRLGYDRRAFLWQTLVAIVVLPISYLATHPRENINWVYGFGEKPQNILPASLFVLFLMIAIPLVIYLPMHFLFGRIFQKP